MYEGRPIYISRSRGQAKFNLRLEKENSIKLIRPAVAIAILLMAAAVSARANQLGDFLGRRVTSVQVEIEGAPGSGVAEMQGLLDVVAGQDYSPVRIHDSLVRLHRSGLISGARVEGTPVGTDGVALRFIVRPQARIDSVLFEGETVFPTNELRSRLDQLDTGEKLSEGAVTRGVSDLQAFYAARGYYRAQITTQIRLDPTGTRAVVTYTVAPGEQARVSKYTLNITGERLDLSKIKHAIVEGQPYMQSLVRDEVARIRQIYLEQGFLAVRITNSVTPDPETNTVAVTITLEAGPRITITIEGLEIDEKTRREIIPFYSQSGIDEFSLEEGRRKLQDYAQRKGYFFAEVAKPDPPDLSLPAATLVYKVEPGRRFKLTDIDIQGVDAVPSETLQQQLKSKTASFIPLFGLGRGITSNDFLRQDASIILRQLRDLGYRRATVEVLRGVSPTGDNLIITFDVTQGPRTYIEDIGIRGNTVLTGDELRERLTLKPEDPYVTADVSQNADKLLSAYNLQGYATAEVFSEIVDIGNVNGQDRVRLVFAITEGNRIKIRRVQTRGIAVTEEGRLEYNFYLFKEGDYLRLDQLQETERILYDTNAFSSVNITSEPIGETANGIEQRDVTVNIVEAKRYDLVYGFGYQSNRSDKTVPGLDALHGARGLVQLTNNNMFGKLYTGSTQLRVSQTELLGAVSFQNPRPFGNNYPMLISIFARRLAERSFNSDRYTALLQFERRISPVTLAYLSYNFERISNYNLDVSPEEIERNRTAVRLGRIGPSFARDTRNNAFDPSTGTLTVGSVYYASTLLGGNEKFIKMLVEHNRYYPVKRFRDTVYSVSGRLGLASPFGGRESLPISERFFGGGARDLRGFGFEEAGPQVNGRPLGGNAVVVINNELRFPIYKFLGGSVFADTGNVFRRVRDIKPSNLTQTVGFGFRINTPVGPVRFDLGFLVINKPANAASFRRHFTLGSSF